MKTPKVALLIGLIGLALLPARGGDSDAVKADLALMQGEWSMVSGSADGYALPEEMRKAAKRVCQGDEITVTIGEQLILKAKITIDPSKKPKTIDYQATDGPTKGKLHLGIYELDGDHLKSCFAAPDHPRPTDYTGKPGQARTLSTWTREKK